MVYRIFISLMLLVFLKSSLAATDITGAFGIKFGEPISNLKVTRTLANGMTHGVEPPNPLDLLRLYSVETTSETKLVYRIIGQSLVNDKVQCIEDLASVLGILESKYGKFQNDGSIYRLSQGKKAITASCIAESGVTSRSVYMIKVTYEDLNLVAGADAL
jgi:hypothetical protein